MNIARARLLLVDDDPRNLSLLGQLLAPLGCEVVTAGGGRAALDRLEAEKFDLLLLDLVMPELDGLDVLTHLRARSGPHVPCILLTAHNDRENRLRGYEAGADEFLEKPVDRALLLTRVRTLLRLKETSDELARRNAELERLTRAQRELTSFIVHDLKNPIAVLQVNVPYARRGFRAEPELADEALEDSEDAIQRLRGLVNDLLGIALAGDAELPLRLSELCVRELLQDVARLHRREAALRQVELLVESSADLRLRGDSDLLRRVLENLVDNALRHTPAKGRIALNTWREDDHTRLVVSNNGSPIPDTLRPRLFEQFGRIDQNAVSQGHVGLGLYFCRRVAEAHGGTIELATVPGWPVSFVLSLPPG